MPSDTYFQTKPSSAKLPSSFKANAVKMPVTPNISPAAKIITRVKLLPSNTAIGNAAAIQEANQGRGLRDAKEAAEAAHNVMGMPKQPDGINPDLGISGNKGPDLSTLPGHNAGIGFEDPTGRLPILPNNQDKGNTGGAPIGATSPRDAMGGATSDKRITTYQHSSTPEGGRITRRAISTLNPDGGREAATISLTNVIPMAPLPTQTKQ